MKSSSCFVIIICSLLLSPLALGNDRITEFTGFIHFCSSGLPDNAWETPGGTTFHIRGQTNVNYWDVDNPLIDGYEANVVSGNLNPRGGAVHLDVTLVPDAGVGAGTWEITQTIQIGRGVGHGVGHGTGDLHGLIIKFTTGEVGPLETACPEEGVGLAAELEGVIIFPASY